MKTALVSGGTGFVGYNLANELSQRGYKVTVIDRALNNYKYLNEDINFILGDIKNLIMIKPPDYVYHLAALRKESDWTNNSEEYISTNVYGTYNIVKSFPHSRVVFTSSSAAVENLSLYGVTKKSAEHFISLHKNATAIRLMNVFGERQTDLRQAIPAFCHALKYDWKATIDGDGKVQRDYVYVLDVVNELIRIGESSIKGRTETGYGIPVSTKELYTFLCKTFKKKPNVSYGPPRKGDIKLKCSKFKIAEPRYGFKEGIRRTVHWCLQEKGF